MTSQNTPLESKVEAKCFVESLHDSRWNSPNPGTNSLNRNRSNLFCLSLGIGTKPGCFRGEFDLKGVDAGDIRGDWYNRHHPTPEATGRGVGAIVAHDDGGAPFVRLSSHDRVEAHKTNLPAEHRNQTLSPTVTSQSAASSASSQDTKASS